MNNLEFSELKKICTKEMTELIENLKSLRQICETLQQETKNFIYSKLHYDYILSKSKSGIIVCENLKNTVNRFSTKYESFSQLTDDLPFLDFEELLKDYNVIEDFLLDLINETKRQYAKLLKKMNEDVYYREYLFYTKVADRSVLDLKIKIDLD